ncbi:hypothetical protein CONCODRAFT_169615 [Conidiobolus coronatus NRRL 28638]|uniref:G-protein coupled receptors family 1 profile domain-containing protein n=1 Tax=Conidiobolus coronatus (strain ATCC 28846 / CBS 209.66 / NRRL 28638) TaxID=796925 RepID=A0A137PA27_CONC2|nr:hypothetical protein CONCODRAFT_169615 [Conidiobolus coronatus NRRL 28638]|eukprot:KXN71781.1 hypothetical protein CONCODRAFT_169615 [Conidiobolus coronatus NRRL 28638]
MDWHTRYVEVVENAGLLIIIVGVYGILVGIVGAVLTGSLLMILRKYKWRQMHIDMKLATMMVTLDFIASLGLAMDCVASLLPWKFFVMFRETCSLCTLLLASTYHSSVYLVSVISIERCLLVVYGIKLPNLLYYIVVFLTINVSVVLVCVEIGFDQVILQPIGTYCLFDPSNPIGYVGMAIIAGMGLTSLLVTAVSYVIIAIDRRTKSRKEMAELGLDPKQVMRETNSTIMRSLTIAALFVVAYIPELSNFVIALVNHRQSSLYWDFVGILFLSPNTIFNPVILLAINQNLWNDFKLLWIPILQKIGLKKKDEVDQINYNEQEK